MSLKFWRNTVVFTFVILYFFFGFVNFTEISAAPFIPPPPPPSPTTGTACTGDVAQLADLECLFSRFVGYLIPTAGLIFFFMFLVGGFKYITSGGDPKAVAAAHATLTYASFGLILAALSYLIIFFVYTFTGNLYILNFVIFRP